MRERLADLERPASIAVLRWAIGIVLVASLLAFVVKGANNPKDPSLAPPEAPAAVVTSAPPLSS